MGIDEKSFKAAVRKDDSLGFVLMVYLTFNRQISSLLINSRFIFMKASGTRQNHFEFFRKKMQMIIRKPFGNLAVQRILEYSRIMCFSDKKAKDFNKASSTHREAASKRSLLVQQITSRCEKVVRNQMATEIAATDRTDEQKTKDQTNLQEIDTNVR